MQRTKRVVVVWLAVLLPAACGSFGEGEPAARAGSPVDTSSVPGDDHAAPPPDAGPSSTTMPNPTTTATATTMPVDSAVTLAFGGDIHFEKGLATTLAEHPERLLAGVGPLAQADLAVVNLETAIGSGGRRASKQFTFQAPPSALAALTAGGVDVISMANNHGMDHGVEGLHETLAATKATGARVIGIGHNEEEAYAPAIVEVKGRRIAVIAATQVLDGNLITAWTATPDHAGLASAKRVERLLAAVTEARAVADTVVVLLHWGTEQQTCPNAPQRELAPQLAAAGADVIVGGHAHRVLGGGYLGGAYVHYGLGNFVFYSGGSGPGAETGVLTLTARGRAISDAAWHPGRIGADDLPVLLDGDARADALARWEALRSCTNLRPTPTDPEPAEPT